MLYLIDIEKTGSNSNKYTLFETHTDSMLVGDDDYLKLLIIKYKMEIKNVHFDNGNIQIKQWPYPIKHESHIKKGTKYILLAKLSDNRFKLAQYKGHIVYMSAAELKDNIEGSKVVNCKCTIINGKTKIYKSSDTYTIKENAEFEIYIALKYQEFISKSLLLGLDMSLRYIIENEEVKITNYKGTSKKVIIPNFITTIQQSAFVNTYIEEIQFNSNLKYIGKVAFENCRLRSIVIPESVQLMGKRAFAYNGSILYTSENESKSEFNSEAVKILNNNIQLI